MAREDFYLTFGSNAERFGKELAAQLASARSELGSFAAEAQKIERDLESSGRKGQFTRLVSSIGEANAVIREMVDQLQTMKGEFRELAGVLKSVANQSVRTAGGATTDRPAPGTPAVPTSNAGRVSPTAQADAGRVGEISQEVQVLLQTLLRNREALSRAVDQLSTATTASDKTKYKGQQRQYERKIQDTVQQLMTDHEMNVEQIQALEQREFEKAATNVGQKKKGQKRKTATKKVTQQAKAAEEETKEQRREDERIAEEEQRAVEKATKPAQARKKTSQRKTTKKVTEEKVQAAEEVTEREEAVTQQVEESAAAVAATERSLEENQARQRELRQRRQAIAKQPRPGAKMKALRPEDQPEVDAIRKELATLDKVVGDQIRASKGEAPKTDVAQAAAVTTEAVAEEVQSVKATQAELQAYLEERERLTARRNELATELKSGPRAGQYQAKRGKAKEFAPVRQRIDELDQLIGAQLPEGASIAFPGEESQEPAKAVSQEVAKTVEETGRKTKRTVETVLEANALVREEADRAYAELQAAGERLDALPFQELDDRQKAVIGDIKRAGGKIQPRVERQPLPEPSALVDPGRVARGMVATRDVLGEDIKGLQELVGFLQEEQRAPNADQEELGTYIQDAQQILSQRTQMFERVDQSEFSRGLDILGLHDEAMERFFPALDARTEAVSREIESIDAGHYDPEMGVAGAGDYRDDLVAERRELRGQKQRALDARRDMMNQLIDTFPVEALTGLDEGALNLPENLRGRFEQRMQDRGQPLATAPVRRLLGEATSIQRLPEQWRRGAVGATGGQEHDPLRMMAEMPAYTPGQADTFREALRAQEQVADKNRQVQQQRTQEATQAVNQLLEVMPELSLADLRTLLNKSSGVSKQARNSLLAAARFLDELAVMSPEGLSAARVAGAQKRDAGRFYGDLKFADRRAQYRRQTGDTDRLNRKQRRQVNKRDLQGAFTEAMFGSRQVAGDTRGLTERTFRLFDEGGLPGLQSQARTPQQQQALKLFQDTLQEGLGRAVRTKPVAGTTRDPETGAIQGRDLEQELAGAEDDEQRAKIQKLIDRKKEIERQETEWIKTLQRRWDDLQRSLAGDIDPETEERVAQEAQERADRKKAREEVGLPAQPPAYRQFRVPREGELAEQMGVHRERIDEGALTEAQAAQQAAKQNIAEIKGEEQGLRNELEERKRAYEEVRVAAEGAQEAVTAAERAPAPASERTQQLANQYERIAQFEGERLKRESQGERVLKPELQSFAKEVGVTGTSRMTKEQITAALTARKGELGRERDLSAQQDALAKTIPPELTNEALRLSQAADRADDELRAATAALTNFYERLNAATKQEASLDRQVLGLRGEDRSSATKEVLEFERLNDAITKAQSGDITEAKQIPSNIRDDLGIDDVDMPQAIRQMQARRHALMMGHMGQYMDFDPTDARFSDITTSPEDMFSRFDEWAREVQGSGRTPDDAAREDLARRESEESQYREQYEIALERVQRQRAAEASRRAQTSGGMGDCCNRIVSVLERIHARLTAGLRVSGRGQQAGDSGFTKRELDQVARAGGVKGFSTMRKAELEDALRTAGLLEKAERALTDARRQSKEERAGLTDADFRQLQREELPGSAQEFLGGEMVPDQQLDNAAQLVGLLKQSGYQQDEATRVARTQLGLTEQQSTQLRERLTRMRAEQRGVTQEEAAANRERERGSQLYKEQLDILQMMSPETQKLVQDARSLTQASRAGDATPEQAQEAQIRAVNAMEHEMSQFRTPDGRVAIQGGQRNRQQQAILDLSTEEFREVDARREMRGVADTMRTSMQAEAPRLQSTLSNMVFGGSGFLERAARSTGTFIVRNMTAGMVFGATRMLRELVREAIHTEAQFIRVSDALEATGRSAAGVRTELMRISTDIGRPLDEVYEIAGNITGAFDDVRDVEFGTRIVAQLELISDGVLKAKDGFDALQTIAAAFELEGVRELARIQDTAVAIQNVMAIGVDDTVQGIGGLAGIAKEMNFELEETAVLVAAVAKGTNQGGKAAAEQFGRILSTFETQRGRNVLLEAGVGDLGMFQDGEIGSIVFDLIRNWDNLTEAQQANVKATYGSRREARAFNALINRREQILQTLIETENAYGLGQQRVAEVMREIANQIKIAATNFTNFGAVLVRGGVANFFGVMLRGFNATMSTVNEFLSVLNDLADANPITRFAREAMGVLGGLAVTMKIVSLSADRMFASLAAHAATEGALATVPQTTWWGRRIHESAARSGAVKDAAAGTAAGTAARQTRRPLVTGAVLGAATRPRGRLRRTPGGGVAGRNTQMTQQQAIDAGLIDPVTGLLIAQGLRGIAPKITRGVGRGMQGIGQRLLQRGAPQTGVAGLRFHRAGMGSRAAASTGSAMQKIGLGIAALSTAKAWAAVSVITALGASIYALVNAAGNDARRQEEAFNLIAPFMDDSQLEQFEERRRQEDRGWLQQIGEYFRGDDDEEQRRRKEELDAMLPGERLMAQQLDDRDWTDRFSDNWLGQPLSDPDEWRPLNEAFGINWSSIFDSWSSDRGIFEGYVPLPEEEDRFERQIRERYEEETERLSGLRTGRQVSGLPDATRRTLGDFSNELDDIISVDDEGNISVSDVNWLSDDKDTRLGQIERIRGEVDDTIAAEAASLERARASGEIDESEFTAASAALADIRSNMLAQIAQIERQTLGLGNINQLTGQQLEDFVSAMSAIEGVSIPQMAAVPELGDSFDLLFDGMVDEDSSWQRMLDAMTNDQLSGFQRAEAFQAARRDALTEAQRQLEEVQGEPNSSQEDVEAAEQRVLSLTQEVAQGQQELWDMALSQASEMAEIAVELGGGSVRVAERTIAKARNAIERQMDAMPEDSVEYWQSVQDLQTLLEDQASIATAPLQRRLEMLQAQGGDSFDVARGEVAIAREIYQTVERETRGMNDRARQALLEEARIQVLEAERGLADAVESRADALVSLMQAQTEDPVEQAQIGLRAALAAQERAYARNEQDVATLQQIEQDIIEARRQARDAIEGIRRAEMELGLSETQDPRERALLELRDAVAADAYYQGDDPAESMSRQSAVNEARQAMLDAMRADRDAVAQTRIAMERDPEVQLLMEMQLARVQLAEAAEQGTAAYEAARQNLVQLEQQLADQRDQIRLQQFATRMAATEDPVRQAAIQIERAREEMRQAVGQLERTAAHEGVLAARRAEAEAIQAVAQSQLDLASAIAQAQGNTVRQAQIQLEAARMALRMAKERGMGDAAVAQARSQVIQAESAIRDAVLQDHLDTIDFNREMGVITQGEAIQALQEILNTQELTRDQRRSLLRQIRGLQDDLRAQLTSSGFNIPTEIDLPTAYMVRRSLGLDEIDRDSLPDEWRELSVPRTEIDADLTEPMSDWTDVVSVTNDEVIQLVGEGANEAIDTILDVYDSLGPLMNTSLQSIAQAQLDAWNAAETEAGNGATSTNALTLGIISELPPAMQSELARIASDHQALWQEVGDVGESGVQALNDRLGTKLNEGVNLVAQISHGFMLGIAAGIEPLLQMLGLEGLDLPTSPPRIERTGGGHPLQVRAKGGFGPGEEKLPASARIEQPHGTSGLVQWAEQSTHGEAFIPLSPANRPRSIDIWQETGRRLGVDLQQFRVGGFTSRDISRARAFAMAQAGKPYQWGGVGPGGYDCSGIWSAVVNKLNDSTNAHRRLFATSSFVGQPPAGFERGMGLVSVGVMQGSPGHMAGTLAGMNVESSGGHGVRVGNNARGATDSLFPSQYFLTKGGGSRDFGDDWFDLPDIPDFPDTPLGAVGEMVAAEVKRRIQAALRDKIQEAFGISNLFPSGGSENESGTLQGMVQRALAERGWSQHWPALNRLIQNESSWNPNGQNPNSTAYGLFQFLDSTWAGTGIEKTNDPRLQIEAGLRYIENRYGDPTAAWQHWQARVPINGRDVGHWYAKGGIFDDPQMIGVGESGPEAVIPLDQRGARFLSQLLDETAVRAAVRSGGADMTAQQFLRDLGASLATTNNTVGDTRVNIENTFNQSVQSPVQIQQIAQAVIDLLGKQMGGSARGSMITPHLVRM